MDVVDAAAVFGDEAAQFTLVGAGPVGGATLEVAEIFFGGGDCFGFVLDEDVDDAVLGLYI